MPLVTRLPVSGAGELIDKFDRDLALSCQATRAAKRRGWRRVETRGELYIFPRQHGTLTSTSLSESSYIISVLRHEIKKA
jgi:hypothetical protein